MVQVQPAFHITNTLHETVDWGVTTVKAPEVWGLTKGEGIKVAVLDTGIDGNHPDLVGRVKGGINFTSPDRNAWGDVQGHGTHCAGIIAASHNGSGVIGVAPEVELYAVKVLGDDGAGDFNWIYEGVRWAIDNNMDVISMSLGSEQEPPALFQTIFQAAYHKGIPVFCAAGNENQHVGWPAAYPETISVVAIDKHNHKAVFSNYDQTTDIAAPGVEIYSTLPGGNYGKMSGTSQATPIVAGCAALLLAQQRKQGIRLALPELIAKLKTATLDLGPVGEDDYFGSGLIDLTKLLG